MEIFIFVFDIIDNKSVKVFANIERDPAEISSIRANVSFNENLSTSSEHHKVKLDSTVCFDNIPPNESQSALKSNFLNSLELVESQPQVDPRHLQVNENNLQEFPIEPPSHNITNPVSSHLIERALLNEPSTSSGLYSTESIQRAMRSAENTQQEDDSEFIHLLDASNDAEVARYFHDHDPLTQVPPSFDQSMSSVVRGDEIIASIGSEEVIPPGAVLNNISLSTVDDNVLHTEPEHSSVIDSYIDQLLETLRENDDPLPPLSPATFAQLLDDLLDGEIFSP